MKDLQRVDELLAGGCNCFSRNAKRCFDVFDLAVFSVHVGASKFKGRVCVNKFVADSNKHFAQLIIGTEALVPAIAYNERWLVFPLSLQVIDSVF